MQNETHYAVPQLEIKVSVSGRGQAALEVY